MAYIIDQENCSGCHRCRMDCPAGAIRFKNAKYWIDPEKCINCGHCVTVCHNGCISSPDIPQEKPASHAPLHYDCDVCVIGGGGAGLIAAAKAADEGCRVIVLEKNHEIGGSAWYATGFGVHYSKLHAAAGKPDTRAEKYEEFMQKTGGQVNGTLLKRLFQANGDMVDWLIDEHDFLDWYEYNPQGFGPMALKKKVSCPWNDRRIDAMIGPGGGGWLLTTEMAKALTAKGGQILCSTPAKHLLTDENGDVIGVKAEDGGGEIEISCRSVVVASGAFSRNHEIMAKMQPLFYQDEGNAPVHVFTCSTCTGDGITMCEEIGGDIDYVNRRVNMFGPMRHPYPGVTLNSGEGPMFRTDGQRYQMSMGMTEVSDLVNVPHRFIWKITDDANMESAMNFKIAQGRDDNGVDISHFLKQWRQVLQEEAEDNAVVIADTIPELAAKLGFDPVKFSADIEAYNQSLLQPKPPFMPMMGSPAGVPDGAPGMPAGGPPAGDAFPGGGPVPAGDTSPFAGMDMPEGLPMMMGPPAQPLAKGPYYAISMKMFHENSMGGMTIDENASVLRSGKPIGGLYAAGDTTRGVMIPGDIGVQYIEGVFTALTYAFNSGYLAGCEAAKHAAG